MFNLYLQFPQHYFPIIRLRSLNHEFFYHNDFKNPCGLASLICTSGSVQQIIALKSLFPNFDYKHQLQEIILMKGWLKVRKAIYSNCSYLSKIDSQASSQSFGSPPKGKKNEHMLIHMAFCT